MQFVYELDLDTWDGGLGERIEDELQRDRAVMWFSASGAVLTLAMVDDEALIVRHNPDHPFTTDDELRALGHFKATSCGLWDASGYRSSRPIVVVSLDPDRADEAAQVAADRRLQLMLSAFDRWGVGWPARLPAGHPARPCPVPYCPRRRTA